MNLCSSVISDVLYISTKLHFVFQKLQNFELVVIQSQSDGIINKYTHTKKRKEKKQIYNTNIN